MVEFALALPVLFLIVLIIIDGGRLFFTFLHLTSISQDAARIGSLGATETQILEYIETNALVEDSTLLEPSVTYHDQSGNLLSGPVSGQYMTVFISYPMKLYSPGLSSLISPEQKISIKTTIRVE